ncbi:MAG: hypothetical protein RLZZ227_306 [Pseudomonadota bacterium]|jgi:hypothetical protein
MNGAWFWFMPFEKCVGNQTHSVYWLATWTSPAQNVRVLEKLTHDAVLDDITAGTTYAMTADFWNLFVDGEGITGERAVSVFARFAERLWLPAAKLIFFSDNSLL